VPLVMDLRITHDRVECSIDPTLNGYVRYPNKLDQSLNDATADKIRKYRADYNNNPTNTVSFMPDITSTSGPVPLPPCGLVGLALGKETTLRINLNIDGVFISSRTHTHTSHSQIASTLIYRSCLLDLVSSIHNKQNSSSWKLKSKVGSTLTKPAFEMSSQSRAAEVELTTIMLRKLNS